MGAKTWMIVYSDSNVPDAFAAHPEIDRKTTVARATSLFAGEKLEPLEDGELASACPPKDEICAGCFPGVSVFAAVDFGIDYPSKLPTSYIEAGERGSIVLHAMHSAVDWFAFARWEHGVLVRSLSLSPDHGVLEDIGARMPFERPYWNGEYPAVEPDEEPYPLPFHPLELGEAALKEFFGYQLEGIVDRTRFDPWEVPLMRFRRSRPWWRLWR